MPRKGENIRKRKDGRWEARLITGHDQNGKARYKYLYARTYAEVKSKKYQFISQPENTTYEIQRNRITFGQVLNEWLFFNKPCIKESTYARYVFCIRKHIEPDLGDVLTCNLSTELIEEFKRNKLERGKLTGNGGLSPKTVSDLLSIIKLVLKFGVERNYGCPADIIIHYPRQRTPQIKVLSAHDQECLEKRLVNADEPYMVGIMISLYAGLRLGEVCALKWGDISFDNRMLSVERTVMRIQNTDPNIAKKTKIVIERPKTECSIRKIPLPDHFATWLETYRHSPEAYILTNTAHYMEPRNYYKKYKFFMEACSLGQYNYHALRHTFATRCVEHGFDIKSLSEILGHSDVGITMKRYVHPSFDLKRKHMENLYSHSICSQNLSQVNV